MKKAIIFRSDVEEIVKGENRTVSVYLNDLNDVVQVTAEKKYMSLEDGIDFLIDMLKKHQGIDAEYIEDITLTLRNVQKSGNNMSLIFVEDESKKIHEFNFKCHSEASIADFVQRNKKRLLDMLKENLKVEVVKVTF